MIDWLQRHNYGLTIALLALYVGSHLGQLAFQLLAGDGWLAFAAATFENWQSEFLQLLTFVILTTYLIHKDSPQSADFDEDQWFQVNQKLDDIQEALRREHAGDHPRDG